MIAIFYFLLLAAATAAPKQLREKIDNLRRGDTVVTAGGILGRVVKAADAEDPEILVEIADNVQVKVLKATLTDVRAKGEPAEADKSLMLQVSPFTRILVALIVLGGILIALPNALPDNVAARIPAWLPQTAVSLGLDLQGGSYLLLEVDFDQVQKDKAEAMIGDIRAAFRKAHIHYHRSRRPWRHGAGARHRSQPHATQARKLIDGLNPAMTSSVLSVGAKEYDIARAGRRRLHPAP